MRPGPLGAPPSRLRRVVPGAPVRYRGGEGSCLHAGCAVLCRGVGWEERWRQPPRRKSLTSTGRAHTYPLASKSIWAPLRAAGTERNVEPREPMPPGNTKDMNGACRDRRGQRREVPVSATCRSRLTKPSILRTWSQDPISRERSSEEGRAEAYAEEPSPPTRLPAVPLARETILASSGVPLIWVGAVPVPVTLPCGKGHGIRPPSRGNE